LIARLLLLALSSVLAVGVAEIVVRTVAPQYMSIQTDRVMWTHDPYLGWKGRADSDVFQGFDDARKVAVKLNSRGFREREVPYEKDSDGPRVLVLGDSVAFGFGVELEDRFSERIAGARPDIELVNLSVTGYATDQELLLFRREGRRYSPDVVLLVFVPNDAEYNGRSMGHGHPKPSIRYADGELVTGNTPVPEPTLAIRIKYGLQRYSALFNLLRERLRATMRATGLNHLWRDQLLAGGEEAEEAGAEPSPDDTEYLTSRLLRQLDVEVRAAGARLLIVVTSAGSPLEETANISVETLGFCERAGLVCADVRLALREAARVAPGEDLFLQDRAHWSPAGHRAAADFALSSLESLGWLPPPTADDEATGAP